MNNTLQRYKNRSYKFHIIKLKTLIQKINTSENKYFSINDKLFFNELSKLKALSLIEFGSDFFWSSVHYLDSALEKNKSVKKCIKSIKIHGFDSFFTFLPKNHQIELELKKNFELILPKLNLQFKLEKNKKYSISKKDENLFEISIFNKSAIYSTVLDINNIPFWLKLKSKEITKNLKVLFNTNYTFYNENDFYDCSQSIIKNSLLSEKIFNGIKIIEKYSPEIFEKIQEDLHYIIPFGKDENTNYPNFAIATLKKTLFLSVNLLDDTDLLVTESIIHEFAHCELHTIQDTILISNIEHNILEYYSPWRKDLRPLLGLVHGIYISNDVIKFYYNYYKSTNQQEILEIIKTYSHQVFIAFEEIKKSDLTKFGIELIESIKLEIEDKIKELGISKTDIPKEVYEHRKLWKR